MADEPKSARVQLLMPPSEVKAVDDWSFANRVRGRSEAMRRLIETGLNLGPPVRRLLALIEQGSGPDTLLVQREIAAVKAALGDA